MKNEVCRSGSRRLFFAAGMVIVLLAVIPLVYFAASHYLAVRRDRQLIESLLELRAGSVFEGDRVYLAFSDGGDDDRLRKVCELVGNRLVGLGASNGQVTDHGLGYLNGLVRLEELDLRRTSISNAGLPSLTHLDKLEELKLADTNVSDAGLPELEQLHSLRGLFLERTKVRGPGLAQLATLPHLERLFLDGCAIDDQGLQAVLKLKHLRVLWLSDTKITRKALRALRELKELKNLSICGIGATKEDIQQLRRDLPQLEYVGVESEEGDRARSDLNH